MLDALAQYWGYTSLRPVQEEAISLAMSGRDSLVVMPTGGGKSLCYQIPPLIQGRLSVVVSPLIALMKDQVDGLRLIGYPAAALHSGQEQDDQREVWRAVDDGSLRLLFIAPERLLMPGMLSRLARANNGRGPVAFAIDEAHCISQWGHDFRPEYRRLRELRDTYPRAVFNAFTATATPRVRDDIVAQLGLRDPGVLVGVFDRPNLVYRVVPKSSVYAQTLEIVRRHDKEAVIVYAISRKNTEELADFLKGEKVAAEAYHAGMNADQRKRVQDAFAQERINVVVATVAFGMGIDRSNVRCVVHSSMPKSIEHYQQETGRAGRDGLPAECVLLYSGGDVVRWNKLIEMGGEESGASKEWLKHQRDHVGEVQSFAVGAACRHQFLSEYFGQPYQPGVLSAQGCGACDVCLGELESVPDSTVVAQKIISCVARMNRASGGLTFGVGHLVGVLRGSMAKQIVERGHDTLTTFGLLRDTHQAVLSGFVNQLIDMGLLQRTGDQYPTVDLTDASWEVMRGERKVALVSAKVPVAVTGEAEQEPFDTGVFEALRALRAQLASERGVPAYIIFSDNSLRDMARIRPTNAETFRRVTGVGEAKAREFGHIFTSAIADTCANNGLATNQVPKGQPPKRTASAPRPRNPQKATSFEMFKSRANIADVAERVGLALSTIRAHLVDFIETEKPGDIGAWVDSETYRAVTDAARNLSTQRMKFIFEHLGGQVSYDHIAFVLAHLRSKGEAPAGEPS
ncbi:MAG: RecQ family ATP-dependent DNA helicase [Planctomycetes bacterium]|nr:RecQ family ATP-dependent DNA helicase [Planctomycetota bacterium]